MFGAGKSKRWRFLITFLTLMLWMTLPLQASPGTEPGPVQITFATNQEALDYYLGLAETLEVTTAVGKSVFYSGPGNRVLAEQFALGEDKMTLEMTAGGKLLDDLRLFEQGSPLKPDQAMRVWSRLSQRYAQQAAGDVYCFVVGARPTGVFTTVELPELKKNRKVGVIYVVSRL